jgi:hypothetical protein
MAKIPSEAERKVAEIEPFDNRKIELAEVKPELSAKELQDLIKPAGHFSFPAIETLNATKTVGRGRTNLTLIAPTVFQTDATVPRAIFDVRAQTRKPAAQMHFQPSGYGITSVATYLMDFTVETIGQSTFNLQGGPFNVTILNAGTKTLNGLSGATLIFKDLPPSSEVYGFLEQTSGAVWYWFSISVRFPDVVIAPA